MRAEVLPAAGFDQILLAGGVELSGPTLAVTPQLVSRRFRASLRRSDKHEFRPRAAREIIDDR